MLVKILDEELTERLKELFETKMNQPVELLYFYDIESCDTCDETGQLLEEITSLSDKLQLRKIDRKSDQPTFEQYKMELTPGLVVTAGGREGTVDHGIRFFGLPSGYEFGSLIQAIVMVSSGDSGLKYEVRKQLAEIKKPIHLQVFVTPT